jgi:outer membrane immunogenic protein
MGKKLISLVIASLSVGGGQVASAADLAVKAPVYKAPPPVYFTWTGFYAGANAGGAWGTTTATDIPATNTLCWNRCGDRFSSKPSGFTGGGQAGYNWQFGNFVLGVEGDIGYLGVKGVAASSISPTTLVNTSGGVFATARARVGYAFDHVLVYGTGGWMGADVDSTVHEVGGSLNTAATGFQSGWTAGGGLEWAFAPRWSLKGEYLHYDLGDQKVGGVCCGGGVIQFFNIKNSGEIVRTGVNYHF